MTKQESKGAASYWTGVEWKQLICVEVRQTTWTSVWSMFSIYLVLGIGCSHAKFNQSKGMEREIGAGSQIKELKQTLLFQTFCQQLTQVASLNLTSGPQLASMDSIHIGVGHFNFIQGYILYK